LGTKVPRGSLSGFWGQLIFKSLHQKFDVPLKEHPSSAVHDLNIAALFLVDAMRAGKQLYCFDLSSATDRFPVQWQMAFLKGVGLEDWIPRLRDICCGWKMPTIKTRVDYAVGQPMGLYASFPLFHMTHIALLETLCLSCDASNQDFMVRGDDVVITHPGLAEAYREEMVKYGVEISETKSLISSDVAEFGGFLGLRLKGNKDPIVFLPYKWNHSNFSKESTYSLCHFLGRKTPKKIGLTGRTSISRRYELFRDSYFEERSFLLFDLTQYPEISPIRDNTGESIDHTRLRLLLRNSLEEAGYSQLLDGTFYQGLSLELLGDYNITDEYIDSKRSGTRRPTSGVVPDSLVTDAYESHLQDIDTTDGRTQVASSRTLKMGIFK